MNAVNITIIQFKVAYSHDRDNDGGNSSLYFFFASNVSPSSKQSKMKVGTKRKKYGNYPSRKYISICYVCAKSHHRLASDRGKRKLIILTTFGTEFFTAYKFFLTTTTTNVI